MSDSEWELTTELLMFDSLPAFQKDPSVCEPGCKLVLGADGAYQPSYYGKEIENKGKGVIFCNWENYEAHEKVLHSDLFPKVKAALLEETLVGWDTTVTYHTIFSDEPIALDQPVTEVTVLTLKKPENRDPVVELLARIAERSGGMFVFGVEHDNDQKYMALDGWNSVQAYRNAASKPKTAPLFKELWSLADKNYHFHTPLFQLRL